jgi:transposase
MSLPNFSAQSALFTTLTTGFFGSQDRYRLFAEKISPVLVRARATLEQAYCSDNGRPGIEPILLAGVTLLQFLEGVPDRQAVEMLHYHLGWQFALNRNVESAAFHPSTLANFRQRLIGHDLSRVVFNQLLEALQQVGLVERQGKQRLDSTQVMGLLSRMSRLECVRETLRLALQELEQSAALFHKPGWWPTLVDRYVSSKLDYRTEANLLKEKMNQAGADAWTLIEWVKQLSASAIGQGPQYQLLGRVLGENFQCSESGVTEQRHAQPAGAVHNPHEPEAQWAAKGQGKHKKEHVGYKVQVAESVGSEPLAKGEPTRSFLTGIATQPAIASDEAGAEQIQKEQATMGLDKPSEMYVDGAYISAEKLAQAHAEGRELIGPAPAAPQRDGRFSSEDFQVRVEDRRAVCPAGKPSTQCSRLEEKESGHVNYRFEWSYHCKNCPLRDKCVGADQPHRTLVVGQHHTELQTRRQEQKTEAFQEKSRRRNAIEGTQSELVRAHGLRKARYRGLEKNRLQNYFIGAACNAKRWIRRMVWEIRQAEIGAKLSPMAGCAGESCVLAGQK